MPSRGGAGLLLEDTHGCPCVWAATHFSKLTSVSIVTATFNCARHLRDCLDSVAGQSVPVEHIVVDGGSSDGTLAIIEDYRPGLARVVVGKDHGIYDALNKGIGMASADVVGILHADDMFADEYVIETVGRECNDNSIAGVYGVFKRL